MAPDSTQPAACTLAELARHLGGEVRGDGARPIHGVAVLGEAGPGQLSFYNNARYRDALRGTGASAVLVREESVALLEGPDALVVADPYLAFARASTFFNPRPRYAPGVDPRAVVEAGAQVDPSATVMAFAYVAAGAQVGPRAVLFPHVFVGGGAVVGEEALLYPGVILREGCQVGARCILQPGVALGGDGFGFAFDAENLQHFKIPQVGRVVVEEDVEIGANSAIDRATLGETRIGRGTKIDNLVQIGHNVQVGPLSILCGQVGIAGSSTLGMGVVCGGQAGIGNHVKVGDRARVGPKGGVMSDVEEGGEFLGSPLMKAREYMRAQAAFARGPDTLKTVARLERRIAELEAKIEELSRR